MAPSAEPTHRCSAAITRHSKNRKHCRNSGRETTSNRPAQDRQFFRRKPIWLLDCPPDSRDSRLCRLAARLRCQFATGSCGMSLKPKKTCNACWFLPHFSRRMWLRATFSISRTDAKEVEKFGYRVKSACSITATNKMLPRPLPNGLHDTSSLPWSLPTDSHAAATASSFGKV